VGTLSAGPLADAYDGAEWRKFVDAYKTNYPASAGGYPSPSLFAYVYYVNTKAALDGLAAVNGDLSGNHAKYRDALQKMVLKTPTGDVRLDSNRQAIGTTFITEVVKDAQGNLYNKVLAKVDNVNQTLGVAPAQFKIGSRDVPACP
jgi:branched-chain amino acid transport system substrate-binding protein